MGPFEEKLREVLGEVCSDELLTSTVEAVLEAHCSIYAQYAMSQVMIAQSDAADMARVRKSDKFAFAQGQIAAFQELFGKVAFDGLSVAEGTLSDQDLDEAQAFWRQKVEALLVQMGNIGV